MFKSIDKFFIVISGSVGAGKTTAGNFLKEKFSRSAVFDFIFSHRQEWLSAQNYCYANLFYYWRKHYFFFILLVDSNIYG